MALRKSHHLGSLLFIAVIDLHHTAGDPGSISRAPARQNSLAHQYEKINGGCVVFSVCNLFLKDYIKSQNSSPSNVNMRKYSWLLNSRSSYFILPESDNVTTCCRLYFLNTKKMQGINIDRESHSRIRT